MLGCGTDIPEHDNVRAGSTRSDECLQETEKRTSQANHTHGGRVLRPIFSHTSTACVDSKASVML